MAEHGDIEVSKAEVRIGRRSLLLSASALAMTYLLAGCSNKADEPGLRVQLLKDSIPVQLVKEFRRYLQQDTELSFSPKTQLADLFELLQQWQPQAKAATPNRPGLPFLSSNHSKVPPVADLVTLGDYWLAGAVQQNLIQPLVIENLAGWQKLPPAWQAIVRRDRQGRISPNGDIWAAPYRWGTLVLTYNVEAFKNLNWTPTDWSDLWRPEVKGKISLLDSPRTVTGAALKQLGKSVNSEDLAAIPQLQSTLQHLHQQAKFYSSDAYLEPLLLGHIWIAVGWSTDVLPIIERDPRIAAVTPKSGTILTSDLWVSPKSASAQTSSTEQPSLAQQWINFCWQPDVATKISFLSSAASPILVTLKRNTLPRSLQTNPLVLPSPAIIERSEFLEPLADATVEQYRRLWAEIDRGNLSAL